MKPLIHKTCACCNVSKPRCREFPKNPGQPDYFSVTCKQCQKAIKDGKRQRPLYASEQRRQFSSGCNGLLLDAVWHGHPNRREAATAYQWRSSDLRPVQNGGQVLHPLGTPAPQTAWRR